MPRWKRWKDACFSAYRGAAGGFLCHRRHAVSGAVATFTDSDPDAFSTNYNASITYSNGTTSSGSISGSSGYWTVSDTQTFTQATSLSATVTITDWPMAPASTTDSATVGLATISLNAASVSATVGQDSTQNIATLVDSAGSYAGGNYSVSPLRERL